MDDLIAIGGELCATEHLVVSNEIVGVVRLACFDGDLHVADDVELVFAGVDSLVIDVDDLHVGFLVPVGVEAFGEDEDGF